MKADREESGDKVPRSNSGTMRLRRKQCVALADSMHPRQHDCKTNTSHTEPWPLPFDVPIQTTSLQPFVRDVWE